MRSRRAVPPALHLSKQHGTILIDGMHAEHVLCDIDPRGSNLFHDFPSWKIAWGSSIFALGALAGREAPFTRQVPPAGGTVSMGNIAGLNQDDSHLIGFVIAALACGAIDAKDLRTWAEAIVREHDVNDIPAYIFELCDFDGYLKDIYEVVGFVPSWECSRADESALFGIAGRRGAVPFDWPVSQQTAERALARNQQLLDKFRGVFPFIPLKT